MTHTSTEQPEALRLADNLEANRCHQAARELRRLHARVQELEEEQEALQKKANLATSAVYQFHYAMKDAGWHPGRTDDDLTDIIRAKGRELARLSQARRDGAPESEAMTHHTDAERADFEAWARDFGTWEVKRDDDVALGTTGYTDITLTVAWHAVQAARRAPAAPVPQVTPEMIEAAEEAYMPFGDMELAIQCALSAAPKPPEAEENLLQDQLDEALQSLEFYKRRCDLLQSIQTRMRDPERTMVCDVLANGHLLQGGDGQPDKARYAPPEAAPVQLPEPVAYRLRNTAFRSEVYEYFRTKYLAECRQKQFNASVDDGGLHELTPIYTEQQVRALLAAHGIQEQST